MEGLKDMVASKRSAPLGTRPWKAGHPIQTLVNVTAAFMNKLLFSTLYCFLFIRGNKFVRLTLSAILNKNVRIPWKKWSIVRKGFFITDGQFGLLRFSFNKLQQVNYFSFSYTCTLMWHGPTLYDGHLRRPMTLTPVAELKK